MLGPFFFCGNVDGHSYLNLLNNEVIPLMTVLFQNQFQIDFNVCDGPRMGPVAMSYWQFVQD